MWIRTPIIPGYTATEDNISGIGRFIVEKLENFPSRWDLLSFNRLCVDKYSRLDLDWILKDEPLMTKEEIEYFFNIAKSTGVKFVHWSGLTRKNDSQNGNLKNPKGKKLSSCIKYVKNFLPLHFPCLLNVPIIPNLKLAA